MSELPQVKRYLISSITNYVNELPHVLPNDLRLRILENQEILEKCQILVQTQPNAQPSFQKLNVNNSFQKTRKIRYYIFEVLSNFIVSIYFVPNILSRIVDIEKAFDSVNHLFLIKTLNKHGFKEGFTRWIQILTQIKNVVLLMQEQKQIISSKAISNFIIYI